MSPEVGAIPGIEVLFIPALIVLIGLVPIGLMIWSIVDKKNDDKD